MKDCDAARAMFFLSAPSQAPGLVTAHNCTSSSLKVKWSHLPMENFQGQPIGYYITYQSVDFENDINFVRVNHTTNTTKLSSLATYTMYVINVSAVSSGGIGPANTAKARTNAEGAVAIYSRIKKKVLCPPGRKTRLF